MIRNTVVLNEGDVVTADMLPPPLNQPASAAKPGPAAEQQPEHLEDTETGASVAVASGDGDIVPLWKVERDVIERATASCDGNIPKAAAKLGISPSTIYRKKLSWESEDVGS